jgi:hypothetical protein
LNFFPCIHTDLPIIKDNSVPSDPDDPTGCDAYFPEEVASEVTSSFNHHIKMRQAQVPLNWNGIPAGSTERTFKTEVKTCFFSSIVTEHTDIIIKVHTFSS